MMKFDELRIGATLVHCYAGDTDLDPLEADAKIIQEEYIVTDIEIHTDIKMSSGRYVNASITIKSKSSSRGGRYSFDALKRTNAILGSPWHKKLVVDIRQTEIDRLGNMIDDAIEKIRQWKVLKT